MRDEVKKIIEAEYTKMEAELLINQAMHAAYEDYIVAGTLSNLNVDSIRRMQHDLEQKIDFTVKLKGKIEMLLVPEVQEPINLNVIKP